ncbi:MAG: hypothetical protein AAF581_00225 [Planctomycetota bacterium]
MMMWFLKILGYSWVVLGLWWTLRPQGARKRLEKKFHSGLRRTLFVAAAAIGGALFAAGRHLEGTASWLVPALGVVIVGKGLLFLRGKVSEQFVEWWTRQPNWVYRCSALALSVTGFAIQWFARTPTE